MPETLTFQYASPVRSDRLHYRGAYVAMDYDRFELNQLVAQIHSPRKGLYASEGIFFTEDATSIEPNRLITNVTITAQDTIPEAVLDKLRQNSSVLQHYIKVVKADDVLRKGGDSEQYRHDGRSY